MSDLRLDTSLLKIKQDVDAFVESEREESPRMKQFHEKLKLQPIPKVGPRERFVDLVLVEIDSKTGELIADCEKEPTKWGDWQHRGRVTDF
ncbi:PREDICTED: uncharacterized protein LOC106751881 [Dinoponera quadriceps]|uniref:Uncharacterized protein LOC106751881 n=1 Tax=Dinoponera quadriceps TaxID=609295 RepID=A0A6P3YFE3_DINQU|nr:PREDICTED: uncharacterized protein LOC106751881 [Dinoponera quadriceps]